MKNKTKTAEIANGFFRMTFLIGFSCTNNFNSFVSRTGVIPYIGTRQVFIKYKESKKALLYFRGAQKP